MNPEAIIAGYSFDVDSVFSRIADNAKCFRVDEKIADDAEIPKTDLVIYVFSLYTGSSSQLLGLFLWIHHNLKPREEYIYYIEGDPTIPLYFHFMESQREKFPPISIEELQRRLRE
jgi:hypothetical protein